MNVSALCTPAMIYFVIAFIMLVIRFLTSFNLVSLIIKGFFIIIWSMFLNYLCSIGYTVISWILVILPFFVM